MSGWGDVDKPRGSLVFLQLEDGETKRIRILDEEPYTAYIHRISQMVGGEEVFLTVPATAEIDEDFINSRTKRYPTTAAHCLRVAVYDDDGEIEGIRVLQGGIQIFRPLKGFWQRYGDIRKFDVEITRNGTKRETEYQVTLAPDSYELDLEEWIEKAQTDDQFDWGNLFPPVTAEEQQKMIERAKIDIDYDPAEEIAADMEVDDAMKTYCTLNKYGPKVYPPKGKTIGEIMVIDAGYVEWIAENVTSDDNLAAAARVAVRHMNGDLAPAKPGKALPKAQETRKAATPAKAPAKSVLAKEEKPKPVRRPQGAEEQQQANAESGWTLKMSPEEYLEKFPRGPKADLARQMIEDTDDPAPVTKKATKPVSGKKVDREALIASVNEAFDANPDYQEASDIVDAIKRHGNGKTRVKDMTDEQLQALLKELA